MKAVFFMSHGGPDILQFGELTTPLCGPTEVVVDVHAASVNRADHLVRAGDGSLAVNFPHVPGKDFSGLVAAVGSECLEFQVGQRVFGVCPVTQDGAYAEQIAVSPQVLAVLPDQVSFVDGAALGLAALTALVSIEVTLDVRPGETVLIEGSSGGVGGYAVQLAHMRGAHVIATATAANHSYVRDLGADLVIDTWQDDLASIGQVCDAALQTVGGETALRAFTVLKPGGRAAFIGSGRFAPPAPSTDIIALRPRVDRERRHMDRIAALAASGQLRVIDIRSFPLAQAIEAHRADSAPHRRSKTVLDVVR